MYFSLVVPIYNRRETISKCIDSILNQRYEKYEIIIVDDGSCDGSGLMCDKYTYKYDRVKVCHQSHQGVSTARNTGIKIAEGDYIVFVDSDDAIPENYLLNINKAFQRYGNNVVYCTSIKIESSGKTQRSCYSRLKYSVVGIEEMTVLMNAGLFNSVVNKVYRKDVLEENHIEFFRKIDLGEDLLFNLRYLNCLDTQKFLLLNHTYYNVDISVGDSLDRQWRDNYFEIQTVLLKECLKFLTYWRKSGKWSCSGQEYLRLKRNLYDICLNGSLNYYKSFWGKKPSKIIVKKMIMIRRSSEYMKYLRLKKINT